MTTSATSRLGGRSTTSRRSWRGGRSSSAMSFVTREEASMLEAEQPEERDREVARRPPLLQCIEVGSPASPGSRNLDAKPKRSCLSTQHGGAVDGGGERVWGVLGGPGRRGSGSWWRRAEDQQAPEGPGF